MHTKILEIAHTGSITAGVLDLPARFWPQPGQYLPCQRDADHLQNLPTNLFRVLGPGERLYLAPLPNHWLPGDIIQTLSPHGRGFSLPPTARRIGLLALDVAPLRLLPLVNDALSQNAAVVLFWNAQQNHDILHLLPAMVEVSPTTALVENLDWLEYLAIDMELTKRPALESLLGTRTPPFEGQVLVRTSMPCRGIGECGVCAVKTPHGWKLSCIDGPVFNLQEVLHVA